MLRFHCNVTRSQIKIKFVILRIDVLGLRRQGASQSVSFPTSRQVPNCLNDFCHHDCQGSNDKNVWRKHLASWAGLCSHSILIVFSFRDKKGHALTYLLRQMCIFMRYLLQTSGCPGQNDSHFFCLKELDSVKQLHFDGICLHSV